MTESAGLRPTLRAAPIKAGDVIGFFSAPQVEQHWTEEVWDGDKVTGSPNR